MNMWIEGAVRQVSRMQILNRVLCDQTLYHYCLLEDIFRHRNKLDLNPLMQESKY